MVTTPWGVRQAIKSLEPISTPLEAFCDAGEHVRLAESLMYSKAATLNLRVQGHDCYRHSRGALPDYAHVLAYT